MDFVDFSHIATSIEGRQSVMELTSSTSSWELLQKEAPFFPRGWFELSRLNGEDRKEFLQIFWKSQLLDSAPNINCLIDLFFASVEDILIFLVRQEKLPPQPLLIYASSQGHFFGYPPISKERIARIQKDSLDLLPEDYLNFFSIHDGFSKEGEGKIFALSEASVFRSRFQERMASFEQGLMDPKMLIPFFQEEKIHRLQCFFLQKKTKGSNLLFDELQGPNYLPSGSTVFSHFSYWLSEFLLKKKNS